MIDTKRMEHKKNELLQLPRPYIMLINAFQDGILEGIKIAENSYKIMQDEEKELEEV